MAIEKDLKRIADALELIAGHMTADKQPAAAGNVPAAAGNTPGQTLGAPVVTSAPAPALTEAPAAPAPAAPAPAAAPAAASAAASAIAPVLSPEEMNTLLVSEFKRIGDRTPIDAAMGSLGVISVTDLPADKQQSLIAAVAAIPSAA